MPNFHPSARRASTRFYRTIRLGEQLEPRIVLDATVVFNEVMYHPAGGDESLEFIELYNQNAVDMDISKWRIAGGADFTFPNGTIILGGGHLVVAKNPAALLAESGFGNSLGPYTGQLANGGELIELRDHNNRLMDLVEYDDAGRWPVEPDGSGVSLAKIGRNSASGPVVNWGSSVVVGGTPGRANFADEGDAPAEDKIQTLVAPDSVWRLNASGTDLGTAWRMPDFNDSLWQSVGPATYFAGRATVAGTPLQPVTGLTAIASSALPGLEPIHSVDGSGLNGDTHVTTPSVGTMWQSNGRFLGVQPDLEPEISFDLGQVRYIDAMRVWNYNYVDTESCCLDRGIARADIYIAGEDGVFTKHLDDVAFQRAPGTVTNFAQTIDLGGTVARYVKIDVDTTNGIANYGDRLGFVGLSEVQFLAPAPPAGSQLPLGPNTYYFRHEFDFNESVPRTQLLLNALIDDGAVIYLNGVEVYRHNMPDGPIAFDTRAAQEVGNAAPTGSIQLPTQNLVNGRNVLSVEVHQAKTSDADMLFGLELTAITAPPAVVDTAPIPVVINELSGAQGEGFFVELYNYSDEPVGISQFVLALSSGFQHRFPAGAIVPPGGFVTFADQPVARIPYEVGDRVFLYNADQTLVVSGAAIQSTRQGRFPDGRGELLFTDRLTAGEPNQVTLQDAVVINEVMYHHRPEVAQLGPPATPYREIDEEWIELYNRSASSIDLSDWRLADAADFRFAAGTTIPPGGYVVVANDAAALRQKYPTVADRIVGDFQGTLNNGTDRIVLLDARGNPADVVEYYEDGQWPAAADGRGSSLELRDPDADNSVGLAWAASEESDDSPWQTYTYQGVARASAVGPDGTWQEFVLGLLADGEVLLDDISVVEDPGGAATELIQNGSFEADAVGDSPSKWRIIGNHRHSQVIVDPDNPNNKVLRFVATSATEHMHNHAETTLKNGDTYVTIRNGTEYRISYRAKWITGSNLLNSRLYFNRLPRTTVIAQPALHGTPGAQNSRYEPNLGPTYEGFRHGPVVPEPNQPVTISVDSADPDGVAGVTLWYSVNGSAWNSVQMSGDSAGHFVGQIPGQAKGAIVQFYVEGTDGLGARSTFPRAGADSRALYQVNDGRATDIPLHNFRMILTPDDADFLHNTIELMSNDRLGATVIYDEREVFYDAGIRLSGSERARPFTPRLSFSVAFPSDQLFRGVFSNIILDRSESTGFGQRELIYHHGMSRSGGGLPSEYNDLFHIITPRNQHTGGAEAQMARYTDVFLDSQYENGSAGQVYEYELVYFPTTTNDRSPEGRREGRKVPQPDDTRGTTIRNLGDDKENYRWTFLIRSNRAQDDYSRLMEFAKFMGGSATQVRQMMDQFIDVDQWLRAFAFSVISGHGDHYGAGDSHNLQLYVRPSDQRVLFLPHDLDAFFDANRPLIPGGDLNKLIGDRSDRTLSHMYLGHVHDMIQTVFNEGYMKRWTDHFGSLLPAQRFDRHLSDLVRRSDFLLREIRRRAAEVEFQITTTDHVVDSSLATVEGTGWVNVRQIRLAGSTAPLEVIWATETTWRATVPVGRGANPLTLEAYDFQGKLIGSGSLVITSTADNPVADALRVTEINYNPADPSESELAAIRDLNNDDFEFVEVTNVGSAPVNLSGVQFNDAIQYVFPSTVLEAGQSAVVVSDVRAFRLRYGEEPMVVGQYTGQLSNAGERLLVRDPRGNLLIDIDFDDNDPWPQRADGVGATLELADPAATPIDQNGKYYRWRGSTQFGGSPGTTHRPGPTIAINELLASSTAPAMDAIELFNYGAASVDLSGWYLSDSAAELKKYRIPAATILSPGQYLVLDERQFNPTPNNPRREHFALNGTEGDDVWLTIADADGQIVQFVDDVHFGASATGESWGRVPEGNGRLAPMSGVTLGQPNAAPRVGPVVISEIQYAPGPPSAAALALAPTLTSNDLEFVEIHNTFGERIDLTGWHLRGGVDFDFAAGTALASRETLLVISFDPASPANASRLAAFRAHYGIADSVRIVGGYGGQLNDQGELLCLLRPGQPLNDPNLTPRLLEDEVLYDNLPPWPAAAAGTGRSLTRAAITGYGSAPSSWTAGTSTPGRVAPTGDFNNDGRINAADVDLLCTAVRTGNHQLDLDGDGRAGLDDMTLLVESILNTRTGDVNLDGLFDSSDLVRLFQIGEYEDGVAGNSTWSEGDWNCDGEFDSGDLVLAFRSGGYT